MSDMYQLTPRAQQVLSLARKEADRLNHNFVGTEHVLLGLIALGQGAAVNVLQKLGLDLQSMRQEVESGIGTGPDRIKMGTTPPYTPRVRKALNLANEECRRLDHTYLGTEHILLGLLREGEGVAAKIMRDHGIDLAKLREEILRELGRDSTNVTEAGGPQAAKPAYQKPQCADTSKRYDVYCFEGGAGLVVYRNARLKGIKKVFPANQFDSTAAFYELELVDGQLIFVSRFSVIKFGEPGSSPGGEKIPPNA